MGHRHIVNTGQMFDPNDEQSWKHMHPEQPYGHFARAVPSENNSLVYPVDNMSIDATPMSIDPLPYGASHWNNSIPNLNTFPISNPCVEIPRHQPDAPGPSHNPFMNPSSGSFSHQASSSKRKSPGVPTVLERGSSSRCYSGVASSDHSVPSDMWKEKRNMDCENFMGWNNSNICVGNEGAIRNVRSRALFEGENNITRANLSAPNQHNFVGPNLCDRSCTLEYMGQGSDAQMRDWGHFHAPHGRSLMPDANVFNHETNNFIIGGNNSSAPPLEIGPYHNNLISNRSPIPQNIQGVSAHSTRGSRSSYSQRSAPIFRGPSSSNVHRGNLANNNETHMGMENYSSRNLRPLSTIGWRSNDRSGRARISSERFRSTSDEAALRSRLTSEGLMIVDRSGMFGPINVSDQHSDMRLDVDNMTYEELLALGERIGSVSTGLSEELVSKCLNESVYCSSDHVQYEERCVICLDEYKDMDNVGTLRKCGHDFHVGCIKKWLFMKNLCPICKASAAADQN